MVFLAESCSEPTLPKLILFRHLYHGPHCLVVRARVVGATTQVRRTGDDICADRHAASACHSLKHSRFHEGRTDSPAPPHHPPPPTTRLNSAIHFSAAPPDPYRESDCFSGSDRVGVRACANLPLLAAPMCPAPEQLNQFCGDLARRERTRHSRPRARVHANIKVLHWTLTPRAPTDCAGVAPLRHMRFVWCPGFCI